MGTQSAPAAPDVSVVVPVRDEEATLRPLFDAVRDALEGAGRSFELVFVDDGSTDGSYAVMGELHGADPRVKAVRMRANFGKAAALAAGMERAAGGAVVMIDADLQDDPAEIPALLEKLDGGLDLVSGWRRRRHDPLAKTLPSRIFNAVTACLTGVRIHDFNCGLKAMRREVAEEVDLYGEMHRFIPALAAWRGFRVGEMEVQHRPRRHGRSKYGFERMTSVLDLLTVMFLTRFTRKPSHVFGVLGLLSLGAGLAINAGLTVRKIVVGHIAPHYPLLALGVLLMIVGVQGLSFGLIGEMITQAHQRERKGYSIRETLE
jgi:glycosyltransferase involved in cell wall biosynthesis